MTQVCSDGRNEAEPIVLVKLFQSTGKNIKLWHVGTQNGVNGKKRQPKYVHMTKRMSCGSLQLFAPKVTTIQSYLFWLPVPAPWPRPSG